MVVRGLDRNAIFGGDMVRQIAGDLVEYQKNGGTVVFEDQ
jgi:hypothetical protein